ncbi:hypothetical protein LCGC14_0147280 [marine sediment metagenome]|uniref:DNA-directed DNA polymerase family A palm domain-containing protein n=1 Tax=marine sediment metagenome TaxID=412755 RepID=A0A0F9XHN1_9ZZZZ
MKFVKLPDPIIIDTREEVDWLLEQLVDVKLVAIDTETDGESVKKKVSAVGKDRIYCWSMCWGIKNRILLTRRTVHMMKKWLEDPSVDLIMHNAKYDMHVFANHGIMLGGILYDTFMMDCLVDENRYGSHNLKSCATDYLGLQMVSFKKLFGNVPLHKVKPDVLTDYATKDAWATYMLFRCLRILLKLIDWQDSTYWDYYVQYEVPYTRVLWNMERRGISVDIDMLAEVGKKMAKRITEIEREFTKLLGRIVNLNSPTQLIGALYGDVNPEDDADAKGFGLPILKWTKGGKSGNKQPSTAAGVLEDLAERGYEPVKLLLEHRELSKAKGTYSDGLTRNAKDHIEHRIHTSFNQGGATTGRLSSSQPNLQNVPRPGSDQFGLRKAFVPPPGRVLVAADYGQIEPRLTAHFSQDENMLSAIRDGLDNHSYTAALMYGQDYDEVISAKNAKESGEQLTPKQKELLEFRNQGKITNLAVTYGQQDNSMAANLGKFVEYTDKETGRVEKRPDKQAAQEARKKYFDGYPMVYEWILDVQMEAETQGRVFSLLGRYRRLNVPDSVFANKDGVTRETYKSMQERASIFRQAVNFLPQGSAADIIKCAMIEIENNERLRELEVEMLLQVHDELVFYMPDDERADEAMEIIEKIMISQFSDILTIPLVVDIHKAYAWADAH